MVEISHMSEKPEASLSISAIKTKQLIKMRYHLDAPFILHVHLSSKSSPLLETVGLRVPAQYISEHSLLNVCSSSKNCPSARCTPKPDVSKDVDLLGTKTAFFNHIL
jgi:hypothetical protein